MEQLKEVLEFVESEIEQFSRWKDLEFNQGVVAALSLVRGYLKSQIEWEAERDKVSQK